MTTPRQNARIFDLCDEIVNPDGYADTDHESDRRGELRDELESAIHYAIKRVEAKLALADEDDRRDHELSEAGADLTDALRKLYDLNDGDGFAVGEFLYECDKAARTA